MNNRTIFEISNDLLALEMLLAEAEGDVTDESSEAAIDSWLAELGEARDQKLDSYARLIRAIEGDAEIVKAEADRLKARQKALESRAARLKDRLEAFLRVQGIERIETPNFTFAMQKAGGKPKVILNAYYVDNPAELPEGLRRVKFEADLNAIREALEADEDSAIKEIAQLDEPIKRLRIK